jgi:hypothetical protein
MTSSKEGVCETQPAGTARWQASDEGADAFWVATGATAGTRAGEFGHDAVGAQAARKPASKSRRFTGTGSP